MRPFSFHWLICLSPPPSHPSIRPMTTALIHSSIFSSNYPSIQEEEHTPGILIGAGKTIALPHHLVTKVIHFAPSPPPPPPSTRAHRLGTKSASQRACTSLPSSFLPSLLPLSVVAVLLENKSQHHASVCVVVSTQEDFVMGFKAPRNRKTQRPLFPASWLFAM